MHQPPSRASASPELYIISEAGSESDSELDLQPDLQPDPDSSFKTDTKPYSVPDSPLCSPLYSPPPNYPNLHPNLNTNTSPSLNRNTDSISNPNPNPNSNPNSSPPRSSDSDSDSDRLHETRPNRWRGHPSTWQTWTERDRRAWLALENARKEDLAVHLYNAFALRRGLRVGPDVGGGDHAAEGGVEGVEGVDEGGDEGVGDGGWRGGEGWEPGKAWTAWPMRADEVPGDGLLPRTADVNEPFTFRREQGRPFAGSELEEEISATILRYAKERFLRRSLQNPRPNAEPVVQSIETGDATTEGETDASDIAETTGQDEETDEPRRTPNRRRPVSPTFTPVVSADDERSYALLRPATRRIMSKLDDTLMILHNQRMAGLGNMSESSASDEDETDAEGLTERPSRARPKSRGGGRPRKVHVPLEGETEQEMLVRLARQNRKKLPTFSSGAESGGETGRGRSRSSSLGRGRRSVSVASKATSRASSRSAKSRSSSTSTEANREKQIARWGLRNWRNVLGAAALAGFSPTVIARATQRCSTLFGEGMTIHTLHEQSATSGKAGVETMRYVPGVSLPSSSGEDDSSQEELAQLRTISRQSSLRPVSLSSPDPESEAPVSRQSRSDTPEALVCPYPDCERATMPLAKRSNLKRHLRDVHGNQLPTDARRSRSGTPAIAHFCPYSHCPRAIEGFTKRTNLSRHLREVHGKRAAAFTDDEEDSADEMDGGVHVDGFLQPIKMRKGWRREDIQQRPFRSRKKARAGSEELDSAFF